jgi:environmental stress-induced protein Ves
MASAAQQQKFTKFGKLDDADRIVSVLKGLIHP